MKTAQQIFGYFDKSKLIDIIKLILEGNETEVIKNYRKIYDQGIEPKVFINDFLELVYYFKNINSLTLESTNFSLSDEEFLRIKELSNNVDHQVWIMFWQFTLRTVEELDIVSNQNLSIEMFLMRLMYLIMPNTKSNTIEKNEFSKPLYIKDDLSDTKNDSINQIKNLTQEKKIKLKAQLDTKVEGNKLINSFEKLLEVCEKNREMKLKYELEKNVNLVSFEQNRIEISFNENLDKNFVKDLSVKLYEWTEQRWIITFSKKRGKYQLKKKSKIKRLNFLKKLKILKFIKMFWKNFLMQI